jgi:hypothetical protein
MASKGRLVTVAMSTSEDGTMSILVGKVSAERHPSHDLAPVEETPPESDAGWLVFAAIMLSLGGILGLTAGIVAIADSTFYVAGAHYIFGTLNTWGWIVTAVGAVALASALTITSRAQWARWCGIGVAVTQAVVQMLTIQGYPMWSLCIFAVDVLIIYALAAHADARSEPLGGRTGRHGRLPLDVVIDSRRPHS